MAPGHVISFSQSNFPFSIDPVRKSVFIYLTLLVGALTYVLYQYHRSQPPDQEQIDRCNELVRDMPEDTQEEINRSINTFLDCLAG
jgi:hypothetical protein